MRVCIVCVCVDLSSFCTSVSGYSALMSFRCTSESSLLRMMASHSKMALWLCGSPNGHKWASVRVSVSGSVSVSERCGPCSSCAADIECGLTLLGVGKSTAIHTKACFTFQFHSGRRSGTHIRRNTTTLRARQSTASMQNSVSQPLHV